MSACAKCGTQISAGSRFCGSCRAAADAPAASVGATSQQSGVLAAAAATAGAVRPSSVSKPMASSVAGLVAYLLGFAFQKRGHKAVTIVPCAGALAPSFAQAPPLRVTGGTT